MEHETDDSAIPEQIVELLTDEELDNIENRRGWAIGDVVLFDEDGVRSETFEDAYIELFNGAGRAGHFGGVRFMDVTDGEYEEAYAYATVEALRLEGSFPGYAVERYTDPTNPQVGMEGPR